MKNKRIKIQEITLDAAFLALIILMTFTPIGFLSIPPVSATLLHIPVLVGAYLFGKGKGAMYGLFFGLMSLIKAYQSPTSILDPYFQNPFISVLPRVLFGFLSGLVFEIVRLHTKAIKEKLISALLSFVMTMIHSVLVFIFLYMFYASDMNAIAGDASYNSYWLFVGFILLTQSTIEAALGAVIVPALSYPIDHYALKGSLISRILDRKKKKMDNKKIDTPSDIRVVEVSLDDNEEKDVDIYIKRDE